MQAVKEVVKILEREIFKMEALQIELDEMQMDMVKTYRLEFCHNKWRDISLHFWPSWVSG